MGGGTVEDLYSPLYGKKKQHSAIEKQEKTAKEQSARQEAYIKEQQTKEKQRLAEATSEVEERRAMARRSGGRSLLIKTTQRGVQSLGGV